MSKPSKFSKLAGPQRVLYASLDAASENMASDSIVFLQSGTAKKVTFADVVADMDGTVTSTGLTSTDGVLSVSISGLDAKTAPVAADSIMINDSENSDVLKEVTLTNLGKPMSTVMAGTGLMDGTGSIAVDLDGCGDATLDPAADTIAFIDESASGDPTKLESVVDFVDAIRGTASTTGITSSSGVLTAAIKIAHLVADEKSSLFFEAAEVDFGVATAVDTKITDAAAAKGKLLLAIGVVTEVFDGDANNTISISNNTLLAANKMCSDIVVDKDTGTVGDWLGGMFGGMPVTGADGTVTAGNDVYAYSAANTNRGNGKMYFLLVFQKTA
jgi:hypothetical protein